MMHFSTLNFLDSFISYKINFEVTTKHLKTYLVKRNTVTPDFDEHVKSGHSTLRGFKIELQNFQQNLCRMKKLTLQAQNTFCIKP